MQEQHRLTSRAMNFMPYLTSLHRHVPADRWLATVICHDPRCTTGQKPGSAPWVLPTSAPAGPLTRYARKVLHLRTGVYRVVLNNTGSQAYVETGPASGQRGAVVLGLYDTTTGKRVRPLGRLGLGGPYLSKRSFADATALA